MGEAYRGLTIQFKADGTRVLSTLKSMSNASRQVESELRMVKRALRFDPSSAKAAQAQMKLLAEKAGTTRAEVAMMEREFKKLGDVEIGGVKMKELSERTKDASAQASTMLTRYNRVTEELARLHNKATDAWASCKKLSNVPNPFKKGWSELSTEKLQGFIAYMERLGAVTAEESDQMRHAVKALRSEFSFTEAELKKLNDVAAYQSFGNKIIEQTAKAKAAMREMNAAAKAFQGTSMTGTLKEARAEIERTAVQAKLLKEAMRSDPSSLSTAISHAESLRAKIKAVEIETKHLNNEMDELAASPGVLEAAKDAERLESHMAQARAEVDRLGEAYAEAKAKANVYGDELTELRLKIMNSNNAEEMLTAGDEYRAKNAQLRETRALVDELGRSYNNAAEQVQVYNRAVRYNEAAGQAASNTAMTAAMNKSLKTGQKTKFFSSSAFTSMGMQIYSTLYPAVMMGGMYAVESAREVDAAYRDMRKTVQGSEEDFVQLKEKAIDFGNTHYTSADEILSIEAIGGQLGVTVDNLEQFSKVVSDLSIATDEAFETEDIALWLGKMSNIMHISADDYDNFADSLVRLGNSEPALESDIANITTRFAGMASIVGMMPDEILAIATAATATGQKSHAAGGALMRVLGRIETATAGVSEGMYNLEDVTEEDIAEFEAAQDSLQAYAEISGMTAEQFSKAWDQDPTATFQKFINGLKQIKDEGGSVEDVLQNKLGIGSVYDRTLLNGLTQTTKVLDESLRMSKNAYYGISDEFGTMGDAAREAENKSQGFSGTLQIMLNNMQALGAVAAESLTPHLKTLTSIAQDLVKWFTDLDPAMQTMLTSAVGLGGLLGPTLTGIGAFGNMFGSFRSNLRTYMTAENKLARTEGSALTSAMGVTSAYKAMGSKLEGTTKKLDEARKSMIGMNVAQEKHIIATGKESKAIREQQQSAAKKLKVAEREQAVQRIKNVGTRAGAGFLNLMNGVGQMGAMAAAGFAIEQVGMAIYDAWKKNDNYRKSTEELRKVVDNLKNSTDAAKLGQGEFAKSLNDGAKTAKKQQDTFDSVTENNAQLADQYTKTLDGAEDNAIMAQFYADKILNLAGALDGDKTKLEELKAALKEYNNLTGSSLGIVDNYTGRINENSDALEANVEAFKQRTMANAYMEVAQDAMKQEAATNVALAQEESYYDDLVKKYQEWSKIHQSENGEYFDQFGNRYDADPTDMQMQIDASYKRIEGYRDELDAIVATENASYELATTTAAVANESEKSAVALADEARSARKYKDALMAAGESESAWRTMAKGAGYAKGTFNEFSKALYDVGIDAERLANIGSEQFSRLYREAGGRLDLVAQAVNTIDNLNISPKDVAITDNAVEVKGHVIDLENMTIDGKTFTVEDDGSVIVEGKKVNGLKGMLDEVADKNPSPTIKVDDQASSVISSVGAQLTSLDGQSSTVTIRTKQILEKQTLDLGTQKVEKASGGISIPMNAAGGISVPMHAAGGFSVATRAIMTPDGIIGEAGTEAYLKMGRQRAIVPLSNRRYVRPFARAVAAEMPGAAGSTSVVHNHYSINGVSLVEGSDGAIALQALAKALKVEAGR